MDDHAARYELSEGESETLKRDRASGQAIAWIGAALLPLWIPFDWVFARDQWHVFAVVRLLCSALLVAFALLFSRARTPLQIYALTFGELGVLSLLVGGLMAVVTDSYEVYLMGFSIIVWGTGVALSYPVGRMAALQALMLGIIAAALSMSAGRRAPEDLVFAAFFLVTSSILCTAFSAMRLSNLSQVLEARRAQSAAELLVAEERASNLAKSAFLARMSHELRTPLTAILGYSELIGEELEDAGVELVSDDLDKVRRASNHLLSLIDDILDLSRIEAGELVLSVQRVAIGPILDDVIAELWNLAARKSIHLQAEIAPDLGEINTDPKRARQIVVNLVTNALKFTERGGVQLVARRTPEGVRIEVQDSGVGIETDDIARVFEPFIQVDGTTTRKYGGSGLGLAIVRDLAELLGGRVAVASTPGVGSTFVVELADLPVTGER